MSDERVTIEVDGRKLEATKGEMLIRVTDAAGISIPRFCYHKKLSVVANCRMCLVEVEKAPKPLPACATPVMDGMVVHTRSEKAVDAQKGTMEFLLINHPLDCPICDQGGECELQDLSLGYGEGVSRFNEGKRAVRDKNIGPLIATDMTRCIHCTRCVRFGDEIAGIRELGATGRGEHMEIGTYIERSVDSEMSGNVIDLCPVGALTNKPYRYTARPWELVQHAMVAPHDAVGSNIYLHSRRGRVMRAVPRDNEQVNETWISDRDRYGHFGQYEQRLERPMLRENGQWREVEWEVALPAAAKMLRAVDASRMGMLASAASSLEELHLFRRLAEGLRCPNLDHRLGLGDFTDQDSAPLFPDLGQSLTSLEQADSVLIVGSNVRKDLPIVHHRLRKAGLRGASIAVINPADFDFRFPLSHQCLAADIGVELAGLTVAVSELTDSPMPMNLRDAIANTAVSEEHRAMAKMLQQGDKTTVLTGALAEGREDYSLLRELVRYIAEATDAVFGELPVAANAVGAWLAGVLPHRGPGGAAVDTSGMHVGEMFARDDMEAFVLLGLEPELDAVDAGAARKALRAAGRVVALSAWQSPEMLEYADVLLPVAAWPESAGTWINLEGRWQGHQGAVPPLGDSRPGWKVLRVLGNELGLSGFDYLSPQDVLNEVRQRISQAEPDLPVTTPVVARAMRPAALMRLGEVPLYSVDPMVRRSSPLQKTTDGLRARQVSMHPHDIERMGLTDAAYVEARQGEGQVVMPLVADERIAEGGVRVCAGLVETRNLGKRFGPVEVVAAEGPVASTAMEQDEA